MIENFLWSKQKWLRLHIESALYDFVKSEKEIMYNIPALLDSFAFNKMRFDTAVWMPVRFFLFIFFYIECVQTQLKALHFCSFVIASLFVCHICMYSEKIYDTPCDSVSSVGIMIFFTACILLYFICCGRTRAYTTSHQYCSLIWTWHRHFIPAASFIKFTALTDTHTHTQHSVGARASQCTLFIHCKL